MDYSQFLYMKEELSLIAVILILFVVDLFTCPDQKGATPKVNVRSLTLPAVILMTLHTVINLFPGAPAEAFGGMYQYTPDANHHQGSAQRRYHHRATDGP